MYISYTLTRCTSHRSSVVAADVSSESDAERLAVSHEHLVAGRWSVYIPVVAQSLHRPVHLPWLDQHQCDVSARLIIVCLTQQRSDDTALQTQVQ